VARYLPSRRLPAPPSRHSFPTRRSSDLTIRLGDGIDLADGLLESFAGESGAVPAVGACTKPRLEGPSMTARHRSCPPIKRKLARSEEHTSELQSRSDLVCRLLLEKKKRE